MLDAASKRGLSNGMRDIAYVCITQMTRMQRKFTAVQSVILRPLIREFGVWQVVAHDR